MLLASLLIFLVTALAVWAAAKAVGLHQRAIALTAEYGSERIWTQHTLLLARKLDRLSKAQSTTEITIENTATVVQAVHKGISRIPFGILEAIPTTRDTTRAVRTSHDTIAETIYSGIKNGNRLLGHALRKAVQPPSDDATAEPSDQKPPSK